VSLSLYRFLSSGDKAKDRGEEQNSPPHPIIPSPLHPFIPSSLHPFIPSSL
jgi:hypothetical protein